MGDPGGRGWWRHHYLPEPTTFFFFRNWKAGQSFNDSAINAYRSSIDTLKSLIRTVADAIPGLPMGVGGAIAERVADIENRQFVLDSAPVIDGDGSITIASDSLAFGASLHSIPFTIVPLHRGSGSRQRRWGRTLTAIPRTRTLTASDEVVTFIKSFEGFRDQLYNDPAGHCTVGYGTLVHRGNCNGAPSEGHYTAGVTEEQATQLLRDKLTTFEGAVNERVQTEMEQHQFDALVSFCYNVGTGAFRDSTLLRKLNDGDYDAVPSELRRWTKAGGRELPGLVRRREAEGRMFSGGDYSTGQSLRTRAFQSTSSRGLRNNNPGNLRLSDQPWEGKVPRDQNTDGDFEQFTTYAYGVRALVLLLRNYLTRGQPPRNTVRRIVTAYAPAENHRQPDAYIQFALRRFADHGTPIEADTPLTANRPTLRLLAQAIARMENGVEAISDDQFQAGFALLPPEIQQSIGQSLARFGGSPRARVMTRKSYAGYGEDTLETEEGEAEDFGPVRQMTTDVPEFCPISEADDASTDHFQLREFHSKDGTEVPRAVRGNIQTLMEQLEVLRNEVGVPITITSGYRSLAHNESVGGKPRSQHLCGRAADIKVQGMTPTEVRDKIEELIAAGSMRQGGLGLYTSFVHYDTRGTRARW